ncbi:hypothetical protein BDV27DRAFT_11729 [Aspergillus caelatus]|uniref:Uncharacterized protein n=1 Tax=Aspergillus caelatus TaxID=61420 RepID=A0A5N7A0T9_9EURO|nr:uncharacterized protein BDV27DRAFT_11729 [Aspergillus caelatus]KAE8363108.1 hypothetical protein BDV27DRAFT_11729 [Aspergillus caelatus]
MLDECMLGNILSLSLQLAVSFFFTFSLLLPLYLRFFLRFFLDHSLLKYPFCSILIRSASPSTVSDLI